MRNPIRRSKRIGLTQGGRVHDGRPIEKWSRIFSRTTWERLSEGEGLCVIRENPSRMYLHPCNRGQVLGVIAQLSEEVREKVRAVVLRRIPKRDETQLIEARQRYSCVILNAFPRNLRMHWGGTPLQSEVKHMRPWCDRWEQVDGVPVLQWSLPEVRAYYLYHLLLHEIGHIIDPFYRSSRKKR
ncbi:MAG: hypothetical protein IID43_03650 [Planctomycetes bacterium]|nr:hypothetical protein [Planctomycetota bacterium]